MSILLGRPSLWLLSRLAHRWRLGAEFADRLRDLIREQEGRNRQPTAAILDGQTVEAGIEAGPNVVLMLASQTFGRKRHIIVNTLGLLLLVAVHSAGTQDSDGAGCFA